jgi:hypothetical protein
MAVKKFLDQTGVQTLWGKVNAKVAEEAARADAAEKANAAEIEALKSKVGALEEGTYDDTELRGLITAEESRATAAEAQALTDAKAYADDIKTTILGNDLSETYDTLKEIATWIEGDGVDATELAQAIAGEAALRQSEDEALAGRVSVLEGAGYQNNTQVEATVDSKITALNLAATYEAKGAATTAETNANSYTDTAFGNITALSTAEIDLAIENAEAEV